MERFPDKAKHGGAQDGIGMDGEQAGFRNCMTGVIAAAFRAAQNAETRAKGAVAGGIGGAVNANDGAIEGAGQVERASVAGDDQG